MIKVKSQQIATLENQADEDYADRLLLSLRSNISEAIQNRSDDDIKSHIIKSLKFSRDFEIDSDQSIGKIATIGVLTESEFFRTEETQKFLKDERYSGDAKASILFDIFLGNLRSTARRN